MPTIVVKYANYSCEICQLHYQMKNNIRKYLKKKGLMARWVAETLGCENTQMSKYVSGEHEMGVLRAIRLAGILGCSVEELFPINKQNKRS